MPQSSIDSDKPGLCWKQSPNLDNDFILHEETYRSHVFKSWWEAHQSNNAQDFSPDCPNVIREQCIYIYTSYCRLNFSYSWWNLAFLFHPFSLSVSFLETDGTTLPMDQPRMLRPQCLTVRGIFSGCLSEKIGPMTVLALPTNITTLP